MLDYLRRQQQADGRNNSRSMIAEALNNHLNVATDALRLFLRLSKIEAMLMLLGSDPSQWVVEKFDNVIYLEPGVEKGVARYSAVKAHLDHKVPYRQCQKTEAHNMQPLYFLANLRKGSKSEEEVPFERLACGVKLETFLELLLLLSMLEDAKLQAKYWNMLVKQDLPKEGKKEGPADAFVNADAYVKYLSCSIQGDIRGPSHGSAGAELE